MAEFFDELSALIEAGRIKPNAAKIFHGLDTVPQGFQEYLDGKISAYKIVYKI